MQTRKKNLSADKGEEEADVSLSMGEKDSAVQRIITTNPYEASS